MKDKVRLKEIARDLETRLQCNCDLDIWEPEKTTGHTRVCRIHRIALIKEANNE